MQHTRRVSSVVRVVLFSALAAGVTVQAVSAQVVFSMDYSASAYPVSGWQNASPPDQKWTRAHVPGGGPNGQNAIDMTQLYAASSSAFGGQHYWGWWGYVAGQDPAQGSRRYFRFRIRFTPDSNFRARSWDDGHLTGSENKLLIVGDTCGSNCRFILTYDADLATSRIGAFRMQLDGGAHLVDSPPQNVGQWLHVQIELTSSSTSSSGNGGYKIWINNNNYDSPTAQRSGFQLNTTNWRQVSFGFYSNHGLASDGIHKWRHSDFQVALNFDSNWGTGSSTAAPPPAPTNVRVLR